MTSRIIHLLRHGPPARTGLLLGHSDEPAQNPDCPLIRARVASLPLSQIAASDLTRAAEQAGNLARNLDLPLALDPRWRELDFGAWDGLPTAMVESAALGRFWDDPEGHHPPQGERWSAIRARVTVALDTLETDTLVLTHAGAMRAALSVLTGLDHHGVWAIDLPYRALLSFRVWPEQPARGQVIGLTI